MQPSADIRRYIEAEILPKYDGIGGHTSDHINCVIERSLLFADQAPGVNIDMVYIIAAYHDLGRLIDNETHNIESGKMLRADKFLNEHFSDDDVETMAQAVEDHRSSLGHEPRSIYGKIVSSADRNTQVEQCLSRSYDYAKHLHPEWTDDQLIETARFHLREKYSTDGYAAKKMYFDDPDFQAMLVKIEDITRDFDRFAQLMRKHNASRASI